MDSHHGNQARARANAVPLSAGVVDDAACSSVAPLDVRQEPLNAISVPEEERRSDDSGSAFSQSEWALTQLVETFAEAALGRISRGVISELQRLPSYLSGEVSVLRNAWDDICAQVQFQESIDWEAAYIPTIEQIIFGRMERLCAPEKGAIWLQSREGEDWLLDLDFPQHGGKGEYEGAGIPYDDGSVAGQILDYVLRQAADYKNARISKYLDRGSDEHWE